MPIVFERPLGAHRDIKELEYISALHQSGKELRRNASITAEDVVQYLISRHGVEADIEFVRNNLMPGLAGALGDDHDGIVFDLCEVLAILILPHLKEEAQNGNLEFFEKVRTYMLLDVFGKIPDENEVRLTRGFMVDLLETYGECDIAPQVIDALLAHIGVSDIDDHQNGGTAKLLPIFSASALMKACTRDLAQYNVEWTHSTTTHYQDAFHGTSMDISENNVDDVIGSLSRRSKDIENNENSVRSKFDGTKSVTHIRTFPSIDYTAENFASKTYVTILWVLVVILYFDHVLALTDIVEEVQCDRFRNEFMCKIADAIVTWLIIFVQLSILGFAFILLCSFGNSIYMGKMSVTTVLSIFIGMATIFITSVLSYFFYFKEFVFDTTRTPDPNDDEFTGLFALFLGVILLFYQIKALVVTVVPLRMFQKAKSKLSFLENFLVPGMCKAEQATKEAAAFKTRLMVKEAIAMHEGTLQGSSLVDPDNASSLRTSSGDARLGVAMMNFHATADDREKVGSVLNTWKRIWNSKLFTEDGIWIHARLYASNYIHVFVCILYMVIWIGLLRLFWYLYEYEPEPTASPAPSVNPDLTLANLAVQYLLPAIQFYVADIHGNKNATSLFWSVVSSDLTREFVNSILDSLNQTQLEDVAKGMSLDVIEFLCNATQLLATSNMTEDETARLLREVSGATPPDGSMYQPFQRRFLQDIEEELTPERWVANLSITVGFFGAFLATFGLLVIWLPSAASTIMQFRCAAIGSLRDREFLKYRVAPDLTTIIFGSTFWGAMFGSLAMFIIFGGSVFLAFYHISRPYFVAILTNVCGVAVTLGVKILIMMMLRQMVYAGFFRRNPQGANVLVVVLECWNVALTVLALLIRMIKLLLISAFYVGRLDTPMLAPGVGNIGPVPLDSHPIQFRKDLLAHDAHRHPYIERLGMMYMLKLCHGDDFASKDGSTWRLLFVMALFPWMRRYRIDDEKEEIGDDDDFRPRKKKKLRLSKLKVWASSEGRRRHRGGNDEEDGEDDHNLKRENADLRAQLSLLKKKLQGSLTTASPLHKVPEEISSQSSHDDDSHDA